MNIHEQMEQIHVPDNINILTAQSIIKADRYKRKMKWIRNSTLSLFLCILIGGGVLNCTFPVLARNIPIVGGAFAYIQDKLDFAGKFSNYAAEINQNVYQNGLNISVSEVYCDGENLFVSYVLTSDDAFPGYSEGRILNNQIGFEANPVMHSQSTQVQIREFGTAGLDGTFLDDRTFAGAEYFEISGVEVSGDFDFQISISNVTLFSAKQDVDNYVIKGRWDFNIASSVNTEDIMVINVNEEEEGCTIDTIRVSPIMITVYTSFPEKYANSLDYRIIAYGDKMEEEIQSYGHWGEKNGLLKIPRFATDEKLYVYVIDRTRISKNNYTQNDLESTAIVKKVVDLQ